MTLKKMADSYVEYPILMAKDIKDKKGMTVVTTTLPKIIKTKFKAEQCVIDVYHESFKMPKGIKDKRRVWFMNATSYNFLFEKFGDNEQDWHNQEIKVYRVKQAINGKMQETVYAVGSLTKAEERKRSKGTPPDKKKSPQKKK